MEWSRMVPEMLIEKYPSIRSCNRRRFPNIENAMKVEANWKQDVCYKCNSSSVGAGESRIWRGVNVT